MPPSLFPASLACTAWRRQEGGSSLCVLLLSAATWRVWKHLEEAQCLAVLRESPLRTEESWHLRAAVLLFFWVSGVLHGNMLVGPPRPPFLVQVARCGWSTHAAPWPGRRLSGLEFPLLTKEVWHAHFVTHFRAEWSWLGRLVPRGNNRCQLRQWKGSARGRVIFTRDGVWWVWLTGVRDAVHVLTRKREQEPKVISAPTNSASVCELMQDPPRVKDAASRW